MALLAGQVERREAVAGLGVRFGAVFQQIDRNVHLVLLGSDVQRCVAILGDHVWVPFVLEQQQSDLGGNFYFCCKFHKIMHHTVFTMQYK